MVTYDKIIDDSVTVKANNTSILLDLCYYKYSCRQNIKVKTNFLKSKSKSVKQRQT